jgi:hypothetical protein
MRSGSWLVALSCIACSGATDAPDGAAGAAGQAASGASSVSGAPSGGGAPSASGAAGALASAAGSSGAAVGGVGGTSGGAGSAGASGATAGSATGGTSTGGGGTSGNVGTGGGTAGSAGAASTLAPFKGVANSPCAARTLLNVSWYYNWEQTETEACATAGVGGDFVPMIWGHTGAEQTGSSIQSAVAGFVKKGYPYVLGFNEPDNTSQSNITSATAISLLPSFDNAAIKVGTPATQANTTGQAWFKDYMAKVAADTTLRDDFIALHWYGWNAGSCDAAASQLESYIKYAEGFPGNRPIWLTEWSCLNDSAPTADGVLAFYKGALAVFAKHPRVQRYAWYPWTTNCELNNSDGSLTALGTAYAAAPARK